MMIILLELVRLLMTLYILSFVFYCILGSIKETKDSVFTKFLGKLVNPVLIPINKLIPNVELWGAGIIGFVVLLILYCLINDILTTLIVSIISQNLDSIFSVHGTGLGHITSNSGTTFE